MNDIKFDFSYETQEFFRVFEPSLDVRLWQKLVEEEIAEYHEAVADGDQVNRLKEAADVIYVMFPFDTMRFALEEYGLLSDAYVTQSNELVRRADDVIRDAVTYYGVHAVQEAFKRVHQSNMSKLDDDGKPIRREDGKILKGPNYKAPDLTDIVLAVIDVA